MENKTLKVIIEMKDGTWKEFEGEGIVAYAITDIKEAVRANGGGYRSL